MMEKNGELTENSKSDFDTTKKAEFVEKDGFEVADAANAAKLKEPVKVESKASIPDARPKIATNVNPEKAPTPGQGHTLAGSKPLH